MDNTEDTSMQDTETQELPENQDSKESEAAEAEHNGSDAENNSGDLEVKISELQEKLVRQIAETENLRRRYENQLQETRDYSVVSFAKDLLGVIDNLQRAVEHKVVEPSDEVKALIEGVKMTCDELYKVFDKNSITEIRPEIGEAFDYNIHYAISYEETNSFAPNHIAGIMQSGYKIKDRLLRPAIVTVSKEAKDKDNA